MRKLVLLLVAVLAGACRTAPEPTPTPGARFGAEAPRAAVEAFLGAIRAEDLQAISLVWGNERGPLVNDGSVSREEIEQRELLMICFFRHDQAQVLNQVQTGEPRYTVFRVELKRQNETRTPTISTIQGPAGRWYVVDADIATVRDWCARGG
ncbi:MAG TPA: hypothetical protein VFX39_07020 [Gemmatimonadaceae bacterium]|nr:hypothetical protein [Gemmatimonadaceae bacterium]